MADEEKTVKPRRKARLDDMKAAYFTVLVDLEDGDGELEFRFKMRSRYDIQAIRSAIPLPDPVMSGWDSAKRPVFNFEDPGWKTQQALAFTKQNLAVIADLLVEPAIPGANTLERANWLIENVDARVTDALVEGVNMVLSKGGARVEYLAETFHGE